MTDFIRIIRQPYEEPYHLNLVMVASNGDVQAGMEFYTTPDQLTAWAGEMEGFPMRSGRELIFEIGSERPEVRWAYYFRVRVFTIDAQGHSAIHFRYNNNGELPQRQIVEFCIETEPAAINRLGQLLRSFADLKHEVLEWTPTSGQLVESRKPHR